MKNNHIDIVKVLLNDPRVDPSAQDSYGKNLNNMIVTSKTAIIWASKIGHTDIAKVLLNDSRINPNARDKYGWTGKYLNDMM